MCSVLFKVTVPVTGMITIPAASLAGAQIVQTGANTNTTSSGQGTVTVTLPVAGNVVNSGGMVMVCIAFYTPPSIIVYYCIPQMGKLWGLLEHCLFFLMGFLPAKLLTITNFPQPCQQEKQINKMYSTIIGQESTIKAHPHIC